MPAKNTVMTNMNEIMSQTFTEGEKRFWFYLLVILFLPPAFFVLHSLIDKAKKKATTSKQPEEL